MPLRKAIFFISVFFCIASANALLFNHSDASGTEGNSRLLHRHHISSSTKQAAKIAACATVGKGICLGVDGIKYVKKEVNGTTVTEPVDAAGSVNKAASAGAATPAK